MQRKKSDTRIELPSEHGFWVMLAVILVAGVGRAGVAVAPIAAAVGLGMVGIVVGGRFHRQVRKSPVAQVLFSGLIAGLFVPIAGIGRVPVGHMAFETLAWLTIFAAYSLTVRAVFSRAGKKANAGLLTSLAILLPAISVVVLSVSGQTASLPISIVGLASTLGFAIWRPKPRDLKHSGLMMAVLLVLALVLVLVP